MGYSPQGRKELDMARMTKQNQDIDTDLLSCGTQVASDLSCLCLEKLRAAGHNSVSGTSEA